MRKIRVLIVDDSSFVRVFLTKVLSEERSIQVVGTASNPQQAVAEIKRSKPDLLTLDVEMPGMNGLEFLKKLMSAHPMPVIMVSTLTTQGSNITLKALELGAVDFISKPILKDMEKLNDFKREVVSRVKAVRDISIKKLLGTIQQNNYFKNENLYEDYKKYSSQSIIGIGASTGGVQTLKKLIPVFPTESPGMIIVQHMPRGFTSSFAEMLNKISAVQVKEAEDGDGIYSGQALVVPGDYHLKVKRKRNRYYVSLNKEAKINHQRPSVDVTFNSLAAVADKKIIGVLLTGMGKDGAEGMLGIKKAGGYTIVQDEETAVVYGMPGAAVGINAVDEILPLNKISHRIIKLISGVN